MTTATPKSPYRKCPLCGDTERQDSLHVATEYDPPHKGERRPLATIFNFRCVPCGEVYAIRVPMVSTQNP